MKRSKRKIAGWILSGLVSAFLIVASGVPKIADFDWDGKEAMLSKIGWTSQSLFTIGIIEASIALLFLVPRVAFIAAILLAAYLGGATATHVRVGDPFWFPIALGVLAWVALGLRDRRVFNLAFNKP